MKTKSLLALMLLAICYSLSGQNENLNMYWTDTSFAETFTRTEGDYAPYGQSFTPRGTFRILVVYAGFYTPGVYDDNYPLSIWPTNYNDDNHLSVPIYAQSGSPTEILFTNVEQLTDPSMQML